jgi:hypothetical protein
MKGLVAGIATVCAAFAIASAMQVNAAPQAGDNNFYARTEVARVDTGFRVAPVPLTYKHADKYRVGMGSYLVNVVGGCNDCHTNPSYAKGGNPFMGQPKKINAAHYLAGGQAFGPFISRNLTPEHGLPAGRTFQQFVEIIRTGHDLDHPGQLLQVMPWPDFQGLTDDDLLSIYKYLQAIPPAMPGK